MLCCVVWCCGVLCCVIAFRMPTATAEKIFCIFSRGKGRPVTGNVWRKVGEYSCATIHAYPRRKTVVGGQLQAPAALTPGKSPVTYCTVICVGLGAGLDGCGE
jgi:hypothetical protein